MNKTEIQERIEKCESELATLKADLAKCDCTDGIEQEKCWLVLAESLGIYSVQAQNKEHVEYRCRRSVIRMRPAYMPECRQVTWYDANKICCEINCKQDSLETIAAKLHKLGLRMKVTK